MKKNVPFIGIAQLMSFFYRMLQWNKANITAIKKVTERTSIFNLEVETGEPFDFVPGQFITFDLPIHEKRNKRLRSYSIVSAPKARNLELLIGRVPNGPASGYWFDPQQCHIGTSLTFRGPAGVFKLPQDFNKHHIFVCTGTGIAPFRSMMLYIEQQQLNFLSIDLVFGARHQEDILYQSELEELAERYDNFSYHICLSQQEYNGYQGYVHPIYQKLAAAYPQDNVHFLFCGWRDMIDQARQELSDLNYTKEQIEFELYG